MTFFFYLDATKTWLSTLITNYLFSNVVYELNKLKEINMYADPNSMTPGQARLLYNIKLSIGLKPQAIR